MNYLQGLYKPEKSEGDLVDFYILQKLVRQAEIAQLQFVFCCFLLLCHLTGFCL